MSVPQVMIDAARKAIGNPMSPTRSDVEVIIAAALAAAPTEPAAWGVSDGEEIVSASFDRRAAERSFVGLSEVSTPTYSVVPLWVHPPVPDACENCGGKGFSDALSDPEDPTTHDTPTCGRCLGSGVPLTTEQHDEIRRWIDEEVEVWKDAVIAALEAALSVGGTTGESGGAPPESEAPHGSCSPSVAPAGVSSSTPGPDGWASRWVAKSEIDAESRRIAVDALLPESGDEREALVEVMQEAIFGAFDIDSGAREFAIAAFEALRDTLRDSPANTTEEQG